MTFTPAVADRILHLDRVSKRFGAVVVAADLSLEVRRGEALGILGPNGAGKSTLFAMIAGNLAPDGGRIAFDGHDITRMMPARRCRLGIARSFQIPQPFGGMSVFENLVVAACFGTGRSETQVYRGCYDILERCGLAARANMPAGSLTLLDRKRLELARALATEPKLLLLDEVAGGLTEHECQTLIALIGEVHGSGVSVIWVEHVVHALLAVVGRIVVLHGGALIADGLPDAVIRQPAVQEIYMGISAEPVAAEPVAAEPVALEPGGGEPVLA